MLRGWELRYNCYILTPYAAPVMLPTTNAVFSQLTVLLFDYYILVLCISQTERLTVRDCSVDKWPGTARPRSD